jgi:hypothetical protein
MKPETEDGFEITHIHKTWLEGYSAGNEHACIL